MNWFRELAAPPRGDKSAGLKAVCDKRWKELDWEAKVMLWESARAMTERWDQFKLNMLRGDSQGFLGGPM